MRRSLVGISVLVLCAFAAPAEGQSRDPETLRRNYEKKKQEAFVSKIAWEQSFAKAKERARAERKPILAYFTRSYAP